MSIHPRASIRILQNASLRLHRTILTAPAKPVGSLLTRHPDRALPKLHSSWQIWLRTFPIFVAVMTASTLCIFNYQKSSSSVVSSTLYALRMSEIGRRELGDEIYFRDKFPWIWGEMNQLHGRINISFAVKGTKASGHMRFKCVRRARMGFFTTQEWSLKTEDGRVVQLLDEGGADPIETMPSAIRPKEQQTYQ